MDAPTTQPIGPVVDSHPAKRPERITLKGRWVTLAPLDAEKHAEALYEGSNGDAARESVWTYLFDGPYRSLDDISRRTSSSRRARPTRCSSPSSTTPRGARSAIRRFLRIDPPNRVIEVGNIMYTPAMQRTAGATEAQYLFARYVFDELGYRRYEWKCNNLNAPSKRAAKRFGFTFEGVFRQHMIVKGRNRDTAWFAMLDSEWPARKAAYERWLEPDNFDAPGPPEDEPF